MSLQEIIDDLREMGEDEAANKLHFNLLGLLEDRPRPSPTAPDILCLFIWGSRPEGYAYWSKLNDKLQSYREERELKCHSSK